MNLLQRIAYSLGTGLLFAGACVVLLAAWLLFVAEVVRETRAERLGPGWEY